MFFEPFVKPLVVFTLRNYCKFYIKQGLQAV